MTHITLDAEAGQLSEELVRRGIAATTRVRAIVEVDDDADDLDMAAMLQAGGAFDWLADEPDLYTAADVRPMPKKAD